MHVAALTLELKVQASLSQIWKKMQTKLHFAYVLITYLLLQFLVNIKYSLKEQIV